MLSMWDKWIFFTQSRIGLTIPKPAFDMLNIYNLRGEEIATLVAEQRAAGIDKFNWDARGSASGVYLYRLEAEEFVPP